eukprot:Awhi_evm1s398
MLKKEREIKFLLTLANSEDGTTNIDSVIATKNTIVQTQLLKRLTAQYSKTDSQSGSESNARFKKSHSGQSYFKIEDRGPLTLQDNKAPGWPRYDLLYSSTFACQTRWFQAIYDVFAQRDNSHVEDTTVPEGDGAVSGQHDGNLLVNL